MPGGCPATENLCRLNCASSLSRPGFVLASVLRVAEMLPADDAALDELIGEMVSAANQTEFTYVVMAALVTGRPVSVRHLPRGAMLMPHWLFLGWIAWHMTGELPEPLLDAVQHTQLARDVEATALYVIAALVPEASQRRLAGRGAGGRAALARVKPNASRPHLPTEWPRPCGAWRH